MLLMLLLVVLLLDLNPLTIFLTTILSEMYFTLVQIEVRMIKIFIPNGFPEILSRGLGFGFNMSIGQNMSKKMFYM